MQVLQRPNEPEKPKPVAQSSDSTFKCKLKCDFSGCGEPCCLTKVHGDKDRHLCKLHEAKREVDALLKGDSIDSVKQNLHIRILYSGL